MENKKCSHSYSKGLNEPRPRLCIHCSEPEICRACNGQGEIHMCGKTGRDIDLFSFKEYVNSYSETDFSSGETFINDMLYGIGLAVDENEYSHLRGFNKFKKRLMNLIQK